MGGAWDEVYFAYNFDEAPPLQRRANVGFRCAKSVAPLSSELLASVDLRPGRDVSKLKLVSDETFAEFRKLYDYAPAPLRQTVDAVDESDPRWSKQKVSFDASYGNQRVCGYLFLPRAEGRLRTKPSLFPD